VDGIPSGDGWVRLNAKTFLIGWRQDSSFFKSFDDILLTVTPPPATANSTKTSLEAVEYELNQTTCSHLMFFQPFSPRISSLTVVSKKAVSMVSVRHAVCPSPLGK